MTEEQKRLCDLIDGHAAAMKAQVVDANLKLEWLDGNVWKSDLGLGARLTHYSGGTYERAWRRLAPAPRLISLDQSDFLGPNRVTHLRSVSGIICWVVMAVSKTGVRIDEEWRDFDDLERWECSRDNGATWSRCEKPAP